MARNLSDSSDISSSLSDEEEVPKRKSNKLKVHQIEDRATSKFYTKDDSQEDLPYVADNVFKVKKTKQNKYKTKFKSKGQSSFKSNKTIDDSKEINYANNYAPNNLEKSYLNNPVAFMKSDIKLERTNKRSLSSSEDSSDSDSINCFSNHGLQSKTEPFDGASCSRTIDSDSNESDDHPSKTYGTVEDGEKSNKGMSLMKKSGYKEGEGLGKNAQGLVNPVQLPTQKGRRGLGFASREPRESFVLDWDPEQEESADILKVTEWLENEDPLTLSIEDMNYWFETGEKKLTYNQTTEFADSEIFKVVNCSKNVLDNIDDHDFRHARTKANPFETVKNGIFQNRAAMKMANIDWACDFMFTDPKYNDGSSMLTSPSSLLYFADICAGPGGFSEYVLWRKSWKAKGVGFTLRNANDFKLNDFYAGSPESFEAFYGHDEDGDVYKPKNILSLERYVMKMTEGKGVHFVMADGGFSVDGQESFQEILSKRLYLCQALAALSILQPGGHFMCKLFDIFTEFSAGLLFLLYQSFKQISIYKPVTSRPANSERYVICKWRLDDIQDIKQYLFNVNLTWNGLDSKEDILSIVPLHEIQKDTNFFRYLWDSNNKLGQIQALSLSKIVAYTKDQRLADDRQKDLKKKCLELWEVKDGVRRAPFRSDPKDTCNSLITGTKDFLQSLPEVLNKENLRKHVKSVYDWHCVLLNNSKPPTYFLSLGGSQVYELVNNQWVSNEYLKSVMMSPGTLVYGELAIELEGEDLGQLRDKLL
ncbi:cap-specific mRNA (nucleoside-2'-O-)-methyltransferase 1 isoform X2 [Metopolophium dirhodum]|uniref:cap-specific mRNA (nucleoside-2'-O-)-methyltransferase 1 isoform X2 n=1 Tax=Metopolophium dirhodum TaxID=44670 RepID=UPI00298FE54D|nr:cap-specific mRNA (nucleoside-2'-O-)-methyltransferase 1 isoform X2 [Metopolophium dirhodum]